MTCQTAAEMDNEPQQQARNTLTAELAKVEGKHPGWHCWPPSELRSYGTRTYKGRCAVTLDAASASLLDVVIDAWVSEAEPRRLAGLDGCKAASDARQPLADRTQRLFRRMPLRAMPGLRAELGGRPRIPL